MRRQKLGRFVPASALLAVALVSALVPAPLLAGDCVDTWARCRGSATRQFFRNEVGEFRYSLLLDGCDIGYYFCSKGKGDGK